MPFPRSGTFHSSTFCSGTFHSGTFHSGTFRPGFLFCCGPFVLYVCRSRKKGGVDVRKREKALVRMGDRSVVMGREVARSEEERGPLGKGRPARQRREGRLVGRNPVRCGTVRPVGEGTRLPGLPCVVHFRRKGCLRSRIGGPNDTNRIKNTRFGLSFNEKFGMFVHMNRIRLAEVTLIGHATGSLSGPCAGRGTGGENIWCFMSPAR